MRSDLSINLRNAAMQQLAISLIDTSNSMKGRPISEVRTAAQRFVEECASEAMLRSRLQLAFVTFGGSVRMSQFAPIASVKVPPISADGDTPLAEALLQAMAATDEHVSLLRRVAELEVGKPLYFLYSDGEPTSPRDTLRLAAARVRQYEESRRGAFYGFGINAIAAEAMQPLFVRKVEILGDTCYKTYFDIISASVYHVSCRVVGEEPNLTQIIRGFLPGPSNDSAH